MNLRFYLNKCFFPSYCASPPRMEINKNQFTHRLFVQTKFYFRNCLILKHICLFLSYIIHQHHICIWFSLSKKIQFHLNHSVETVKFEIKMKFLLFVALLTVGVCVASPVPLVPGASDMPPVPVPAAPEEVPLPGGVKHDGGECTIPVPTVTKLLDGLGSNIQSVQAAGELFADSFTRRLNYNSCFEREECERCTFAK
ncbi:uncharacterized protein LOC116351187 isoform X2 [Contarinia nasturtii]|uniref:uncharacterized protein LOC116351187 isoform X2 n=1 Tax=Contarinia nasturtii TaxID=265458 RepID=UPI0012D484A2|nr:uncharacterized protein LOC116351187 isoform X2 [Contarinia nasturtii]